MRKIIQIIIAGILVSTTVFSIIRVFSCLQVSPKTIVYATSTLALIITIVLFSGRIFKNNWISIFIVPLVVIISGKGLVLIGIAIFMLAGLGIGLFITRLFKQAESDNEINAYNLVLALFLGGSLNGFIVWAVMHFKINYQFVYYLFFIGEIFISRDTLINCLSRIKDNTKEYRLSWGQKAILVYTVFTIVYALVPWYVHDELAKHLYVPKCVWLFGKFSFDPHFVISLDTSIIPQSCYVSMFLMGGEYAVRLTNFLLFALGFILIEEFARKRFSARVALLSVLVTISTPFLLWISGAVFIDSFNFISTVILAIFLLYLIRNLNSKNIILYFLLCVLAFLCKQQAVFVIIPSFIIVTVLVIRQITQTKKYALLWLLMIGPFLCLGILSPVLLHNYIISGNPVFPLYNGIFKSPYFAQTNFIGERFGPALNWNAISQITFHGSKFIQGHNFSFGIAYFIFLALLPLVFFVKSGRKYLKDLAVVIPLFVGFIVLWWIITSPDMRYYIGNVFIGALILGLIIDAVLAFIDIRLLKWLVISVCAVIFATNLICQVSIGNLTSPYPLKEAFIQNYGKSNLNVWEQVKRVFSYATVKYGSKVKCLIANKPGASLPLSYFADCEVETNLWYHYLNAKEINSISKPKDLLNKLFLDKGYDFIIIPQGFEYILSSPECLEFLIEEFSSGGIGLYTPKMVEREILSESFSEPITVTASTAQVRVVSDIARGKREGYKIEIEASSATQEPTLGRYQINWIGNKGDMVGTSLIPFVLTPNKERYISPLMGGVPSNVAAGCLYLTGHDEKPVRIYSFKLLKIEYAFISD